ncbi:MAG: hypothetical protein CMN32_06485 [Saprospirales bacterium]|nr:hypothetical protein [Saprospirales bacterium]
MKSSNSMELLVRNMICSRCLKVVKENLESLGLEVKEIELGRVLVNLPKTKHIDLQSIEEALVKDNFHLIYSEDEIISEKIKHEILYLLQNLPLTLNQNLSEYLSKKLNKNYYSLSKSFSRSEGITIEKYFVLMRVEKAKELIEYGELNFSEIAYELGYGNISHLSGQFKQVTGMSMSDYKKLELKPRTPFDKIL